VAGGAYAKRPLLLRSGAEIAQEEIMTTAKPIIDTPVTRERALHEIKEKHFGPCMWQTRVGTRMLVECLQLRNASGVAILSTWYKSNLPPRNRGGNWPELESYEIYVPVESEVGTHAATDAALTAFVDAL
jgi:hypothetical protein